MSSPWEEEQYITFEDFSKIRLKIGKIIHAENIPGMKKVLKVVVICTNMKPRKIGSMISNGMLLAADGSNGKPIFLTISEEASIGADVIKISNLQYMIDWHFLYVGCNQEEYCIST